MAPPSPKGKLKKKGTAAVDAQQTDYIPAPPPNPGDEFTMPVREFVRPANQLVLTEAELNEEVAKMLTANNPEAPKNIARFNMKEKCYKFEPMVDQTIIIYATDGWLLHKGSDEAKKQMDMEKMEAEAGQRFQAEVDRASHERRDESTDMEAPDDSRQLRNQFNFSERAAQTNNYLPRGRETSTEPPPTATVSGTCTQSEIYDEYIKEYERQKLDEAAKAKGGKKGGGGGGGAAATPAAAAPPAPPPPGGAAPAAAASTAADGHSRPVHALESPALQASLRILDRMANQNMFEEISMDFKYWDDASDAFRPGEGSLLPLWKFSNDKAKRRAVTAICWNPLYQDLFAVGYGSYEFLKQASGLISIYSLKNPSHPEFSFSTESGVMALHFHPEHPNLLAVGCYDGSVLVYDVHAKNSEEPIYAANVKTGKHHDPVWNVFWQVDEAQKALQFVSISSDGNVLMWTLNKSELTHESLMKLRVVKPAAPAAGTKVQAPAESSLKTPASHNVGRPLSSSSQVHAPAEGAPEEGHGLAASPAAGCCLDFCKMPGQESIYLVGTEEGCVHKASKAYSSQYLSSFDAHHLAVYAVRWNNIHPRTFLSASADWSVKLWDTADPRRPIMTFDLADSVGDVAWSPHSATVFAAVTDDGKVHVFDLAENKLLPLCCQKIVKKAKLTKLAFNPRHPILLIGDDKGCVTSVKLSPNLRRASKPEKGQKFEDLEAAKLDRVIEVARKSETEA